MHFVHNKMDEIVAYDITYQLGILYIFLINYFIHRNLKR